MLTGVLCIAGHGNRAKEVCSRFQVISKCLLPVGKYTVLDLAIAEMVRIGVRLFIIIVGPHNHQEITQYITDRQYPTLLGVEVKFIIDLQKTQEFSGTAAAVLSAMPHLQNRPFLLFWADMLFRFPAGISLDNCFHNIIFTTSVSHRQWRRFDGVAVHGDRVMALSSRAIEKPGPFLMTTGVYYVHDTSLLVEAIKKCLPRSAELPVETAIQLMLNIGLVFRADSLDYFIDVGTDENYLLSMSSFFLGE